MNRVAIVICSIVFAAAACYSQDSAQAPAQAPAIGHGSFPLKLSKTLDSSKLKEGEAVEAETSGSFKLADGTLVPKGSKVTGHVVLAQARSKGDAQSQLTVAFDKLSILKGKDLSLKGKIQAVYPPADEQDPGMPTSTVAKGGVPMGGVGGGANAGVSTSTSATASPGYQPTQVSSGSSSSGGHSEPAADPKSVGVHDMGNLDLEDGVLRSKGKNVKLGSGVRLIVHVDILG